MPYFPSANTVTGALTVTGVVTDAGEVIAANAANGGILNISNSAAGPNAANVLITNGGVGDATFGIGVTGDTNSRWTADSTGAQAWGPGNAGTDTTLKRAASGVLSTGKNMLIGSATALGDNGVGEIQLANATTAPTTNPTGGGIIYAVNGTPFLRDSNGTVNPMIGGGTASGGATGVIAETCHAYTASATATPASGTLYIQRIFLAAGQKVSNVGFVTGLTAANGPTHWWTAVLDNGYKQQAHAADQLTGAIAASTWNTLAMATPYTATYSGAYFLAVMIATSTTQPTLVSTTTVPNAAMISGTGALTPLPGGTSTGSLTAPGTDNTTVYATPTTASNFFYLYAS